MEEKLFVKLRDCFQGGYTLPQFCFDFDIKKPLIVSEKKFELFVWEVYVQFHYDKRLTPQFCFTDAEEVTLHFPGHGAIIVPLVAKNFSVMNLDNFDGIIILTEEKLKTTGKIKKIAPLHSLTNYFITRTYVEIPLLNFLQRNPGVKLFVTNYPDISSYDGGRDFDVQLPTISNFLEQLRKDTSGNVKTPLDKFGYTNAQVLEIATGAKVKRNPDGTTVMIDDVIKPLQGIKNGKRLTAYQPEKFLNTIYFFGPCIHFGIFAPYDKTIESYLQKMLNENNLPYRVENESQFCHGRTQDIFYNLNRLNPVPNDIIFVIIQNVRPYNKNIPFFDVSKSFGSPHDFRDIFCTKGSHINELGYKILAEKYFTFLTENNFFRDVELNYPTPPPAYHRYGIPPWVEQGGVKNFSNTELDAYKQKLRARKIPIGAIVMNCNPFTLGHRYLVEYAAAKVARLYIFVVEEDRSEFSFADRFELVKQGVKDIPNVEVIPSGKFIISQTTFSGYFNKASLQDVTVDSSEDVEIFGQEIAPTLGITVRFAGEEPKDNVTRQYNETMKRILPRYGVEFHEIPRKTFGDEVISASYVREALKRGNFDKIQQLVPETTLKYLHRRFALSEAVKSDDFAKFKELMPDATIKHFREQRTEFLRHITARIDIKLLTTEGDFQVVSLSDDKAAVWKPAWFQKDGVGYQIQSYVSNLEFVAKSTVDGKISLSLRGLDIRTPEGNSKRIPYWIDYTKLTINGKMIFDTLTPAWHDKPYRHTIDAKADEEIKIQVEWQPHNN